MARLKSTVFVKDPDGRDRPFGPGEDVPDWAAEQIRRPELWDEPPARQEQANPAPEVPAAPGGEQEPPRSGKGSGLTAWQAYATSRGADVPQDATRDDIIDLLAERGLIDAAR